MIPTRTDALSSADVLVPAPAESFYFIHAAMPNNSNDILPESQCPHFRYDESEYVDWISGSAILGIQGGKDGFI
jgi:hypothetical protein